MPRPRIKTIPACTVAVVEGVGNPTTEVPRLVPALYKAVYASKKLHGKGFKPAGKMRGRYFYHPDAPDEEKRFKLAVPIPDGTTELVQVLPEVAEVKVKVWPEETMAEIIHTGPYATEAETLKILYEFIEKKGYEIVGPHEEEYLSGIRTPEERRRTFCATRCGRKRDSFWQESRGDGIGRAFQCFDL
ncbi:MAG: GyrI-like domain-containing protein [Anaerolineae bacterium]